MLLLAQCRAGQDGADVAVGEGLTLELHLLVRDRVGDLLLLVTGSGSVIC